MALYSEKLTSECIFPTESDHADDVGGLSVGVVRMMYLKKYDYNRPLERRLIVMYSVKFSERNKSHTFYTVCNFQGKWRQYKPHSKTMYLEIA